MSVTMKVLIAASGNHDARVLSGEGVRRPENGDRGEIQWRGGEVIVVTEDLAAKYEASGQAERVNEKREVASLRAPENAVQSTTSQPIPVALGRVRKARA